MNKREEILANMSIRSALWQLSIPAIIGMLINAIYNFVDRIYVAQLGDLSFAAVSIVFPLTMLVGAVGLTFGVGGASYVSRLLGKGDQETANRTAATAIFSSAFCGICFAVLGFIFMEPILLSIGATDSILPHAMVYARIFTLGAVFTMLNMTMNNLLRAEGNAKIAMTGMLIGALLNTILDPLFIFVFKLGISGAAIATVLSQSITTGILFIYLLKGKSSLKISWKKITFTWAIYSQILLIGIPTFIRQIFASLGAAMINNAARPYGDYAISAIGAVNIMYMLALYVLFGINQGFQPIAGYSFGAKKYDRLNGVIKEGIIWTTIYCVGMTILFMSIPQVFMGLFIEETETLLLAVKGLRAISIFLPVLGFMVIMTGLFQALGYGKQAALLALSRQGLFLIPAVILMPRFLGLDGLLFAQTVADFFTLLITIILSFHIFRALWKKEQEMYKQ